MLEKADELPIARQEEADRLASFLIFACWPLPLLVLHLIKGIRNMIKENGWGVPITKYLWELKIVSIKSTK